MKKEKERLDKALVERGHAETRQRAQALILAGEVLVNGVRADKAGTAVEPTSKIELSGRGIPYVSRGGLKLKGALEGFHVDVKGLVCADIGASTGGFTDCLLQEGAARVYAIDVGYGLIDQRLREDPRVKVIERFNVRSLAPEVLGEKVDLATIDVSFISLKLVLAPVASVLKAGGSVIALVKPQFEVGRGQVGKGGIVRDEEKRRAALEGVKGFAREAGFSVAGEMESPITGAKGNREYLLYLNKSGE